MEKILKMFGLITVEEMERQLEEVRVEMMKLQVIDTRKELQGIKGNK